MDGSSKGVGEDASGAVGAIILAAGASSRMGKSKALLRAEGSTFAGRLANVFAESGCDPVLVVGRSARGPLRVEAERAGARFAVNPKGRGGQIASLRAGIRRLMELAPEFSGFFFSPVDCPGVAGATLQTMLNALAGRLDGIMIPTCRKKRGHPVLVSRACAGEFLQEGLSEGARSVFRRRPERVFEVEVRDPSILQDLDTREDVRAWRKGASAPRR